MYCCEVLKKNRNLTCTFILKGFIGLFLYVKPLENETEIDKPPTLALYILSKILRDITQ